MRILSLLVSTFILTLSTASAQLIEVDFDESMGINYPPRYKLLFLKEKSKDLYSKYKALYEKNKFSKVLTSTELKIPKIIHQIWIGPNPIPFLYKVYQKNCKKLYPDWEYKLWTDKDVDQWDFEYKQYYNDAQSYPEKADILRYEILYKYGGVYLDLDTDCIKDFSELNYKYDFFVGIDAPTSLMGRPQIANGLIGTSPGNPIIKDTLKIVKTRWKENEYNFENMLIVPAAFHILAIYRTMFPLTEAILNHLEDKQKIIALPATYFYPVNKPEFNSPNKLVNWINLISGGWFRYKPENENFQFIKEESLTYHNFNKSHSYISNINFDNSMLNNQSSMLKKLPDSTLNKLRLISFAQNYDFFTPSRVPYQSINHIPPVIHHLWLDELPVPNSITNGSFAKNHPEWLVKIWTKKEIKTLPTQILQLLPKLSLTQQKQLLSLAIIKVHGGVYADTCLVSLKSLDEFNNKYNFYAGLLPSYNQGNPLISSKIFAAKPNHVIINKTIENILRLPVDEKLSNLDFSQLLTANSFNFSALEYPNFFFPASYFYPFEELKPIESGSVNLMLKLGILTVKPLQAWPESYTSNQYCL